MIAIDCLGRNFVFVFCYAKTVAYKCVGSNLRQRGNFSLMVNLWLQSVMSLGVRLPLFLVGCVKDIEFKLLFVLKVEKNVIYLLKSCRHRKYAGGN